MNNDRRPNTQNNTSRQNPSVQRQGARPTAPTPKKPQPRSSGANVKLTGSLNTGNFRVQNTGSFKTQSTGSFKTQSTGNFKTEPQPRPQRAPTGDGSVRRPAPARPNQRYSTKKSADDYLTWFLILSLVLLVALVVTFLIIKFAPPADNSSAKLPDDNSSIQAGVSDPDDNETTVPSWTVVPSNLQAFVPKTTASSSKIASGAIHSAAAIMVDLKTGNVISELNPDEVIYPASLTKVMTVIVACEMIKDMNDTFTMTKEITDFVYKKGASTANFCVDKPVTMKDLLYGAILPSGADACLGLAIKLCGSEEAFVAKMNEKAAAMGCTKTRFVNATGLHDDGHYSSVRDLANMLSYAMNNPFLRQVLSSKSYNTTAPMRNDDPNTEVVEVRHDLYSIWSPRYTNNEKSVKATMFAAKTGYTDEAGQCLASVSKTSGGDEYVIVTVGAKVESRPKPFLDVKYLLDTYID